MKTLFKTFIIITLATYTASGQNKDKSNYDDVVFSEYPSYVPADLNVVTTNPGNQKILFENGQVKVTQITLGPGMTENVQPQPWQRIVYVQDGKDFSIAGPNGKTIFDSQKLERPLLYPATIYEQPTFSHTIINPSKKVAINLICVETKQ